MRFAVPTRHSSVAMWPLTSSSPRSQHWQSCRVQDKQHIFSDACFQAVHMCLTCLHDSMFTIRITCLHVCIVTRACVHAYMSDSSHMFDFQYELRRTMFSYR